MDHDELIARRFAESAAVKQALRAPEHVAFTARCADLVADALRSGGRVLLCGNDPGELEFEHLPSFTVDVVRRWPSVEKARDLLGWEARIGVEEGIAQTAEWLRSVQAART